MGKRLSRRSLLHLGARSVAGASLLNAIPGSGLGAFERTTVDAAPAASSRIDALVCIYFFGGADAGDMILRDRLHPALAELQPLRAARALTFVDGVSEPWNLMRLLRPSQDPASDRYAPLRFLPNGFATLEWAAQLAGVEAVTGRGAFTFKSGVSLVAPGSAVGGPQFENTTIRAAADAAGRSAVEFPDTPLGRQLEDVSRLLAARGALGMKQTVFFIGNGGLQAGVRRAGHIEAQYRALAGALQAFHKATVHLGFADRVLTYTDSDLTVGSHGGRIVMGAAVPASSPGSMCHDSYIGAMAWRFGLDGNNVRSRFPGFTASELTSA
jgi:hypothetical protein